MQIEKAQINDSLSVFQNYPENFAFIVYSLATIYP